MWFDDLDRYFELQRRNFDNIFEQLKDTPYYYGYTLKIGADGKPILKEFGNQTSLPKLDVKSTNIDEIVNENEVKFVLEMAGVNKEDIKVELVDDVVTIHAEKGERKYHEEIPIKYKVEKTPKATYKNGILEVTFNKIQPKQIDVD